MCGCVLVLVVVVGPAAVWCVRELVLVVLRVCGRVLVARVLV